MSRWTQYRRMPARVALAAMIVALGATLASAAYDDQEGQQNWQQQQYQERQPGSMRSQDAWQQGQRSGAMQGRNQQLERQVANQLRQEGFGQDGQIMILATGNRVILLGLVPDQNQKQQAEQVVDQISNVQQVDNRLQVRRGTGRQNDSQLQQTIQQQLRRQTDAGQNIQVQARNGRVTLSGQVNDWQEMADVLEAAFAAGAQNVVSQLSTGQQGQYGMGQDQWRGQQYRDQSDYDQEGTASLDRRFGRSGATGYGQTYGQSQDRQQDQYGQYGQSGQYGQYGQSGQYGRDSRSTGQFAQQGQQFSQTSQMQQRLESQLRNQVRGGESLTVLLGDSQAYLFGRVQDEQTKRQAEQILRSTAGVDEIENKITVSQQGWERREDSALENEIQSEMRWSPFVESEQVQIRVNNGVATLSGRVDSLDAAAAIIENAFEGGARSVRNQLQISGQMTARGRDTQMDSGYYPPYGYTPGQDDQTQWQSRQQRDQRGYDQQQQGRTPQSRQWDQQSQWDQQPQWDRQQQQQRGMQRQQQWQQTQQWSGRSQPMSAPDMALAHRVALQLQQQLSTDKTIHVMNPQAIYIHVSQGTVMLHGSVQDNNQKRQIEQTIRSIRGVQNVRNELKIAGQSSDDYQVFGYVPGQSDQDPSQDRSRQDQSSDTQSRSQSGRQQDQSGNQQDESDSQSPSGQSGSSSQMSGQSSDQQSQTGSTGKQSQASSSQSPSSGQTSSTSSQQAQTSTSRNQSQNGSQSPSAQSGSQQQMSASDRQTAQQIEQKLQQQLSDAKINVTVSQGTATLKGSVQQDQHKQQAEQIAKSTSGVQNIRNEITVGDQGEYQVFGYVPGQQSGQQQSSRSDITTAHQIALQLQQQLSDQIIHVMDPQAIYVMVTDGTVMLHGAAQDNNQKQQVERIIQNIQGVQDVRNELQIQGQQRQERFGQQQQMDQRQPQMGQQQQQPMTAADRRLAQQIEQRLEQQLPDANIMARVSQGTVTLQGSVEDQSKKQQAERVARSIQGVRNVQNNLTVGGQGAEYPPLGYVPGQEGRQQQQGQMQQQDTGTGISGDTQCIQMLKRGLTDQNLQSMAQHVYVTCHQGKMALYGYVQSDQEKDQLEKLTKQIAGIKEVDSNLIVRKEGAEQKSDAELQEDVESQLWWSPYVDSDKINVSVQNGTVTVSGEADDWDAMRAAVKNAFDAGAKRVRSQIQYSRTGQDTGTTDRTSEQRSGTTTRQSTTNRSSGGNTQND